jgi:electron transport complex protein RnfB
MPQPSAAAIDALLPQTQCERCGYPGCRPYAEALAVGSAPVNQCAPGGAALIARLATLLAVPPLPLDPRHGAEGPPRIAWIDAEACIGCARCLPPCPVDAIIGAARQLHTVIPEWCNGCELCLPACPVDCIHMLPWPAHLMAPTPAANRERHTAHVGRRAAQAHDRQQELAALKRAAATGKEPS